MSHSIEQLQIAQTPTEMRAELYRLRFHDPLVRNALDAADYSGASAEDRYTVLAYHAMCDRNRLMRDVIHRANIEIHPYDYDPRSGEKI